MTLIQTTATLGADSAGVEAEISLSEFAYAQILDLMLSGRLQAGHVLQERKLAELLSISRTPVREALGRLETENLAMRGHGRVLVVADVSIETYINLLDMRRILELETAARATGQMSPEIADAVRVSIRSLLAIDQPTPADHWAVDDLVHNTIAEAAGNPMVTAAIRDLRRRTHIFNTARMPHRLHPGGTEHMALIDAVTGTDPEASRRLMGQHLDNVRGAIIDFILGRRRS